MAKTLKEMVGKNLQIDLLTDGFGVTNGAGFASYDLQGYRTTVNGIPEYFPETITVSGWDKIPAKSDVEAVKIIRDAMIYDGLITARKIKVVVNKEDHSDPLIPLIRSVIKNELLPGGLLYRK